MGMITIHVGSASVLFRLFPLILYYIILYYNAFVLFVCRDWYLCSFSLCWERLSFSM